jgi:hypothetical protein
MTGAGDAQSLDPVKSQTLKTIPEREEWIARQRLEEGAKVRMWKPGRPRKASKGRRSRPTA